jgi:hypothetical protein
VFIDARNDGLAASCSTRRHPFKRKNAGTTILSGTDPASAEIPSTRGVATPLQLWLSQSRLPASAESPSVRPVHVLPCIVATWCSFGILTAHSQSAGALDQNRIALDIRAESHEALRCFAADALQERIAHYVGTRDANATELRLELHLDADSAELRGYRGDLLVSRRHFEHLPSSCADRRDVVALSIALALKSDAQQRDAADNASTGATASTAADRPASPNAGAVSATATSAASDQATPGANARTERTDSDTPKQPESAATATDDGADPSERDSATEVPEASNTAARSGRPVMRLHLGARGLAEAVPSSVWTGVLGLELWFNPQIAVDLSAMTSTTGEAEFAPGRIDARLTGAELLGCAAWKLGSFAPQGCLGVIAAAARARGRDFPVPFAAQMTLWAATTARLGLRWPAESLISLRLLVQGHVNVVRPELRVRGATGRLSPSWVGGSLGLDAVFTIE